MVKNDYFLVRYIMSFPFITGGLPQAVPLIEKTDSSSQAGHMDFFHT